MRPVPGFLPAFAIGAVGRAAGILSTASSRQKIFSIRSTSFWPVARFFAANS
jgi:hypothetical protein